MRQPTVLLVEDCPTTRDTFELLLRGQCRLIAVESAEEGLAALERNATDIVFLDLGLPGMSGMQALPIIRDRFEDSDVVIFTVEKDTRLVVQAMKLGAYDYITKDCLDPDEMTSLLDRIMEKRRLEHEVSYRRSEMDSSVDTGFVLGRSEAMKVVHEIVRKVAPLPATVLVTGETGTGKEILAREIHRLGDRAGGPFVKVDLVTIPDSLLESELFGYEKGAFTGAARLKKGKFEMAAGGTLFLDEVGDLGYESQAKLLRAIQDGEIERLGGRRPIRLDARIVAATKKHVEAAVREERFRDDLFYRLNVVRVHVPPLRQRLEDIEPLARFFLARYSRRFGKPLGAIEADAMEVLRTHSWPGNVRELEHAVCRCVALKDEGSISLHDLPAELRVHRPELRAPLEQDGESLPQACEVFERSFILEGLEKCDYSRTKAARRLKIPLSTLKYKLERYGIYDEIKDRKRRRVRHERNEGAKTEAEGGEREERRGPGIERADEKPR